MNGARRFDNWLAFWVRIFQRRQKPRGRRRAG
jgi:hypothetical protein